MEVLSVEFSRDGRLIVSGGRDKTVRIWNMDDGNSKVLTIDDPDNPEAGITCAAFSPNGQLVAASSSNSIVYIWDVETGNRLETLRGHRDSVHSVAFTPDGKQLVSGSLDKTLKYWDVTGLMSGIKGREDANGSSTNGPGELANRKKDNDAQCTMDLTGHKVWPSGLFFLSVPKLLMYCFQDYVLSVVVSHDGKWVVSGSKDRCVRFWDSHSGTMQFMLQGHKNSGLLSLIPFIYSAC